jgi:N-formylglutamate deformylase
VTEDPTFELRLPSGPALPLLYDSPHSGRRYPADFRFKPDLAVLRRGEDAYMDNLLADTPDQGATLLLAGAPRCYIDVNRSADDIDAALLSEPWPQPLHPSEKTRKGLGLIRRFVVPGVEVHRDRLTVAEVQRRLDRVYWPYHRMLRSCLDQARQNFGFVWHINWHSMKSTGNAMTDDLGKARPDILLSNRDGASCGDELLSLAAATLSDLGYKVEINTLYKGAFIVTHYGRPAEGIHSLQVEVNRALYLDETAVACHAGWVPLRADLTLLTRRLAEALAAKTAGDARR